MTSTDEIVDAIHRGGLATWADRHRHDRDDAVAAWATASLATCRRIAEQIDVDRRALLAAADGLDLEPSHVGALEQRHEIHFVADRDTARIAVERFAALGFEPRLPAGAGGRRSFWATADEVTALRSDDRTTVLRIRWRGRRRSRWHRVVRPSAADWAACPLPAFAWRLYPLVRIARLGLERMGLRPRDHAALEPFLVTPVALIEPLVELAGVGEHDVVADVGCGDGRIVVEAAARTGCRSIGAEYDPTLVAAARERVRAAGLADRVTIVEGDGLRLPLDEVTVVLLFLPPGVLRRVLPRLLVALRPGARIVAHEQARPAVGLPPPDRSAAIVAADAVTVAHLWIVAGEAPGPEHAGPAATGSRA